MKRRSKILWLDVETTGTDYKIHDIWQLAYIIEIDGVVVEECEMLIRPDNMDAIDDKALEIGGITREELEKIDYNIADAVADLKKSWAKFIDRYDRDDKFVIVGYYVNFDAQFLREMFVKAGDRYGIGSWCFSCLLDVSSFVAIAVGKFGFRFENHKLETVCEKLKIPLEKAHDSMQDIRATRALYNILGELS